jgi:CheY-like chemotaxis protein
MDMQMPGMDGLEATKFIRRRSGLKRQPKIIALTAHALSGDRDQCIESGMDDYIAKPVNIDELKAALLRCRRTD